MPAYTGTKWEKLAGETRPVVTWSFGEFNFSELAQQYGGYKDFDSSIASNLRTFITQAFAAWEAVANIDFVQVADAASVDIRLGNRFIDGTPGPGQSSTLAITQHWFSGGWTTKAEIYFDVDSYDDGGKGFYSTAVHEIGHALGLDHSSDQSAVMYFMLNSQNEAGVLRADDILGAQTLYGAAAGGGGGSAQTVAAVKTAYYGVLRLTLDDASAQSQALAIDAKQTTLSDYVKGLIAQAGSSTMPALVVYDAVYGVNPPNAAKLDSLAAFAQGQANSPGYKATAEPRLGAFEALGMGLAETPEFAQKYGKLTDASFISSAYLQAFGHAGTTTQLQHFQQQNDYFEQLYLKAGVAAVTADVRAKGAVLGQMYGFAVKEAGNAAAADGSAFMLDASDGTVAYNVPLAGFASVSSAEDAYFGIGA